MTAIERMIEAAWIVWLVLLPVAHATGVHNTLELVVPLAVFGLTRGKGLASLPALPWLVALVSLASLSLLWSAEVQISAGKLRSDLLLPLIGFTAAYMWTLGYGARPLFIGYAGALLVLAAMSAATLLRPDVPSQLQVAAAAVAGRGAFPYPYPGAGDASTYAVLVLAPLITWRMLKGHWRDATSTLLALAAVFVIFVSKNRNAVFCFPIAIAVFALLWQFRGGQQVKDGSARLGRLALLGLVGLICIGIGLATVEKASRARLAEAGQEVPFGRAALTLISVDPRPAMWREYIRLGSEHPLLGVGFGRTVPAAAYHIREDPVMQAAVASGFEHAHNVFLNWWLQLGWCGVLLYVGAFGTIVRAAWRAIRAGGPEAICGIGVMTLLVAMLVRNLTDDFLVYGIASSFWVATGGLLGLAGRYHTPSAPSQAPA